jgi:hypothetical protein
MGEMVGLVVEVPVEVIQFSLELTALPTLGAEEVVGQVHLTLMVEMEALGL